MARIAGVDLPRDKRIEIGLTYIFGIGRAMSNDILAATGVDPDIRVRDLSENDVNKLREYIDHNVKVEGDLRRETSMNIKRLVEIGCYPSAARAPSRTPAPARARNAPRAVRRNKEGRSNG